MNATELWPIVERWWSRVDMRGPDECWEWTGHLTNGYGALQFERAGRHSSIGSHRFAYSIFVGPIPDGLHVCHRCDNPPCVNPAHLFVGTPKDNAADRVAKGRGVNPLADANAAKTHCPRGHEFDAENTRVYSWYRSCRICNNERMRGRRRESGS